MKISRRAAAVITFLLLIAIAVLGQAPYVTFGPLNDPGTMRGTGFERYPGLSVTADGSNLLNKGATATTDAQLLKRVGGVLMVSTAEPGPALINKKLSLKYDPSKEDGRRVEVIDGDRTTYMDLFDWEVGPLLKFVDSGHHGAITASRHEDGITRTITLDDAFKESLLGLRLIQADVLPRGVIASQKYLPRDPSGTRFLLGNGERQWLGTVADTESANLAVQPLFEGNLYLSVVLTDAGERFVFSVDADRFEISGTPYYFFWHLDLTGEVVPEERFNQPFRESWPTLKRANPLVIRSMERSFQAAAFFRYQEQHNPDNWTLFAQQVSKVQIPAAPTPRILGKNSKK